MIAAVILVVFPFAMIFAALSDVFTMTIGNRISAVLIGSFLLVGALHRADLGRFRNASGGIRPGSHGHLRAVCHGHDGRWRMPSFSPRRAFGWGLGPH